VRPTTATATDSWTLATARPAMVTARLATARSLSVWAMVMWVRVMARSVMTRSVMTRVLWARVMWVTARVRRAVVVTAGPLMAVVRSVTVRARPAVRALARRGWPGGAPDLPDCGSL
jgi:hypothetical protein